MKEIDIVALSVPIFDLIIKIQNQSIHDNKLTELKLELLNLFTSFKQQAFDHKLPAEQFEKATYALSATIDEVIMDNDWGRQQEWGKQTLQLTLFNEHVGGMKFFTHLQELLLQKHDFKLMRVFAMCLELGFLGRFRFEPTSELQQIKNNLYRTLEFYEKPASFDSLITVECSPNEQSLGLFKPDYYKSLMIMGFMILSSYMIFSYILSVKVNSHVSFFDE